MKPDRGQSLVILKHDRGQSLVILIGKRVTNTKVLLYEESEIIYDDNVVITVSYYAIGR